MTLQEVLAKKRDKLFNAAEKNTKRNEDGLTTVDKNDPWRHEFSHNNLRHARKLQHT